MGNPEGSRILSIKVSTSEAAFIAGFLEGDGCISAKIGPTSGSYRVRLVISFTQHTKNKIVLEYIQKLIGGNMMHYASRNMSELTISNRDEVFEVLNIIFPFLVSKKKQAEIGLEVIATLNKGKRGLLRNSNDLLKAVKLAEDIRDLNSNRKNKTVHTFDKVFARLKEKNILTP
ncbi:MAG: hypothetical protein A2908_02650 [Candidatus Staskawiczbacteria bacterium RIFCSPLOWO2_01_FULL_38_12b]|uniref:Homing endonuclease LAGLIDADG domain-containing protein n=1 Tax=Candidatus Staskawiczbacteria bacterium RIFCSPLOWO2_01_FULL_38_12b TaxID=1802214 RepID=A0A1G2IB60_9BACT|nr:MAG: hypothetical protein A2908_02650 [Candidatus Staskawiczbacteria bacterium RIFCSPLOWO2_01_FULL_38_12b]